MKKKALKAEIKNLKNRVTELERLIVVKQNNPSLPYMPPYRVGDYPPIVYYGTGVTTTIAGVEGNTTGTVTKIFTPFTNTSN